MPLGQSTLSCGYAMAGAVADASHRQVFYIDSLTHRGIAALNSRDLGFCHGLSEKLSPVCPAKCNVY